jgi:hypothetical protein
MDLLSLLVWTLSAVMGYALVFLVFNMLHMHPWTRHTAIALTLVFLTTRLIRIGMSDTHTGHTWGEMPLPQAVAISIFFGGLADIGAPSLIIGAMVLIATDISWIGNNLAAQGGP